MLNGIRAGSDGGVGVRRGHDAKAKRIGRQGGRSIGRVPAASPSPDHFSRVSGFSGFSELRHVGRAHWNRGFGEAINMFKGQQ